MHAFTKLFKLFNIKNEQDEFKILNIVMGLCEDLHTEKVFEYLTKSKDNKYNTSYATKLNYYIREDMEQYNGKENVLKHINNHQTEYGEIIDEMQNIVNMKQNITPPSTEQSNKTPPEVINHIINIFHAENNSDIQESIIKDLTTNNEVDIEDIRKWINEININESIIDRVKEDKKNKIKPIQKYINKINNEEEKRKIELQYVQLVQQIVTHPLKSYTILAEESSKGYKVSPYEPAIYLLTQYDNKKIKTECIIEAVPTNLTIYDDQILDNTLTYKATWKYKTYTTTIKSTIKKTKEKLEKGLGVQNHTALQDMISTVYGYMVSNNQAKIINTPTKKGFYYNEKTRQLITVDYNDEIPTHEQIIKSLTTLEKLTKYIDEEKLAIVLRWALISPYQYSIKQQGGAIKYLYLWGEAGTGKTSIYGKIPLYIWDSWKNETNSESGASDSEAQIRNVFKRNTFPQLYDDTGNIMRNERTKSLLKTSVDSIYTKSLSDKESETGEIRPPALGALYFTSNQELIDDEQGAFTRRFIMIEFDKTDRPTIQQKKNIEKEFNMKNKEKNKLQNLKYLGQLFHQEMKQNPTQLQKDTVNIINTFLEKTWKTYMNKKAPNWIYATPHIKTDEDNDEYRRNKIQKWIIETLNKESKSIVVQTNESNLSMDELANKKLHLLTQIEEIVMSRRIPWLIPKYIKSEDNVFLIITPAISIALKENKSKETLKSIAGLFDWEYNTCRYENNEKIQERKMAIKITFNKFMEDIYEI